MKLCYRSHHTSSLSLHYLVKYQMTQSATPLTRCVINVDRAWHVAAKQPKLKFRRLCCSGCLQQTAYQCWRFTTVNRLKKAIVAEWGKVPQRLVDRAIGQWRRGFDASSSSKADTLNNWCENCESRFLDNNWDNKHVVSVDNFLNCVVTKVVLFLFFILKTLTFHKVV